MNNFGRYYLICNYREKYRPLQIFRVDYINDIEIKEDQPLKRMEDLKEGPKNFSIAKYINDNIYILGGDNIDVTLELDGEYVIQTIKDWFGEGAKIYSKDDHIFASVHSNENAMYYWAMQYADCVKVISPDSFISKIKEGLKKALEMYDL